MIANLPLLFANGNPTALTNITAAELERFISFMVTCSWGHDTAKDIKDIRQPPWWPHDVPFSHPFVRPNNVPKDWKARLQNLVKKCYDYHKSAFLLVFSAQLARYPRKRLRYVDNHDHTTSLYYRPNGRLLVTFRNENIYYDKVVEIVDLDKEPEVKAADIYLCDNCDSHFDNLEILNAHERLCNNENVTESSCSGGLPEFLSALKLVPVGEKVEKPILSNGEVENRPRQIRSAASFDRGPPYPFSSLAYIRNAKTTVQRDTSFSRERIERYCCTSTPINNKTLVSKGKQNQYPVRYRRPIDYWHRKQIFPNQRKKQILDLKGQLSLLKCRPVTVDVERMSLAFAQNYIDELKAEAAKRAAERSLEYVDCSAHVVSRDSDEMKNTDDCEVIDLCSDDETVSVNENCDPVGGVTCVMRGGAVLRRTGAPCSTSVQTCDASAPARTLPPAVLHPHSTLPHPRPVILIAHTLNTLQTISLE